MAAFLIVHSRLTDVDKFQEYVSASASSVAAFGGEYLLGGSLMSVLEGSHDKDRTVVFKFPDSDNVKSWYLSEAYTKVKPLREGTGEFDFLVIESFD